MAAPKLSNPRVAVESSATAPDSAQATKVVLVSWELSDSRQVLDGEWTVEWDSMYPDVPESSPEVFIAPEPEPEPRALTKNPLLQRLQVEEDPGPLSTARILEFENGGLEENILPELQDDLPGFFATRPIVQAPVEIVSNPSSVAKKTEVMFLLAPDYPVPKDVRIVFTEAWTPPNTPPALLETLPLPPAKPGQALHTAWATKRLEDLGAQQEILSELELEGQRGLGQGRIKVGVKGGGMDEEAVRREGWMVGEEKVWVQEKFLVAAAASPEEQILDPLAGLGINTGLHFATRPSVSVALQRRAEPEEAADEEDFFALPLSPRSPEMTVSPFSFR